MNYFFPDFLLVEEFTYVVVVVFLKSLLESGSQAALRYWSIRSDGHIEFGHATPFGSNKSIPSFWQRSGVD